MTIDLQKNLEAIYLRESEGGSLDVKKETLIRRTGFGRIFVWIKEFFGQKKQLRSILEETKNELSRSSLQNRSFSFGKETVDQEKLRPLFRQCLLRNKVVKPEDTLFSTPANPPSQLQEQQQKQPGPSHPQTPPAQPQQPPQEPTKPPSNPAPSSSSPPPAQDPFTHTPSPPPTSTSQPSTNPKRKAATATKLASSKNLFTKYTLFLASTTAGKSDLQNIMRTTKSLGFKSVRRLQKNHHLKDQANSVVLLIDTIQASGRQGIDHTNKFAEQIFEKWPNVKFLYLVFGDKSEMQSLVITVNNEERTIEPIQIEKAEDIKSHLTTHLQKKDRK